jgi:hypothetical protein
MPPKGAALTCLEELARGKEGFGPGYPSFYVPPLDLGGRRWTMSRLLRVGDKVINLDNIEYITKDESSVVRVHFVHRDIELWNEQGEAFRQWVLSNAGYCEGSGEGW